MTTAAATLPPLSGVEEFPEFRRLTENVQDVVHELVNARLWVNWASDTGSDDGHCKFLEGTWKTSPVYFGRCSGPEQLTGNPGAAKLRPVTDRLPETLPKTTALLREIDSINWAGFTRLSPGSKLDLHRHANAKALSCHLGLVIPPGETCGLVVDGEKHIWRQPGDLVIFDGTREHGAWNDSDQDRVVLHIDFVKPS